MRDIKILLLKYIFLFLFFMSSFSENKNGFGSLVICSILIIASNIRMFYLKDSFKNLVFLVLEVILSSFLLNYLKFDIGFYLLFVCADIFYIEDKRSRQLCELFFSLVFIKNFIEFEGIINFYTFGVFIALIIILEHLRELHVTKRESQELYDKLRISEDKLKKANEELESYASSIEEISVLKERNRISREIHDGVGHVLSTTMIQLAAMERIGKKDGNPLGEMAGNLRDFVSDSFSDVKNAIRELKPNEYETFEGLMRINELCKNIERFSAIEVRFIVRGERWNLTEKQENNIYRITQEVLANSTKHSKASKINIIFNFDEKELFILYGDDGIGTDLIKESGVGLKSIKERVKELLGNVTFTSEKGQGFITKIIIPKRGELEYGEN